MSILACEELATKTELQELRDQINAILGQPAEEGGQQIDVLSSGSLAGTLVGGSLLLDMEIVKNTTTKATEIFVKGIGGVSKKLASATRGISRIAATASAAAGAAGSALQTNASTIMAVGNLGISVTNLLTINALSNRLDQSEKTLLSWQTAYSNIYSHLSKANANLDSAKANIEQLQSDLDTSVANNEILKSNIVDQQFAIDNLTDNLSVQTRNVSILKRDVRTLKTNLNNYQEFATEEIETLKNNVGVLERNLVTEEENTERMLDLAQKLGEQVAKLEGNSTELKDRFERFSFTQTAQRIELTELQNELNVQTVLRQSSTVKLMERIRQLEEEGNLGGGVPVPVQNSIANQQNDLLNFASALVGNPATVRDPATDEEIPVAANVTYSDIVNGENDFSRIFSGITATVPDITNLSGGENVTPEQLDNSLNQFGTNLKTDINNDVQTTVAAIIAATVTPNLLQLQNQTSQPAIKSAVNSAVCDSVNTPTGCLNAGLKQPLQNGLSGLAQGLGIGLDTYPWMSDNVDFKNPFAKFTNKINNLTEFTEELNNLVQTGIEVQENVNQVFDNTQGAITASQEIRQSLDQYNTTRAEENTTKETESASPDVANSDLIKDETTESQE